MNKYKKLKKDKRCIDEHRYIMEKHLGRKLNKNEIVHHINGDKSDNRIENLEILSRSEHSRIHHLGSKLSDDTKNKIRNKLKGKTLKNSRKVKQINKESQQTIKIFDSTIKAASFVSSSKGDTHIRECCNGKRKSAYGYFWEWVF